ncbi:hypothetical protein AVEN_124521-1 [Araneus ventricosus]|uniref:Uncharacterized protein n=1 Tax=Araneus ventricosus TaxID=182803 RepID=A0A4Y2WXF6_ARAVE|nr:hypothetical protein AVEN_124521-1 [Araneus ventricosus]
MSGSLFQFVNSYGQHGATSAITSATLVPTAQPKKTVPTVVRKATKWRNVLKPQAALIAMKPTRNSTLATRQTMRPVTTPAPPYSTKFSNS